MMNLEEKNVWRIQSGPSSWVIVGLVFCFILVAIYFNAITDTNQNFVYQAEGFLHGTVFYHTLPPSLHDSSLNQGNYYWAPGPLPAIILMPFVAMFGLVPLQVSLSILAIFTVIVLAYLLARQHKFSPDDSLWLAFAFVFASIYLGVAMRAQAWQVSSALAAVVGLALLLEYRGQNRPWLIGLLASAALATRVTAALIVLLPLIDVISTPKSNRRDKMIWLQKALTPIFAVGLLLLVLNYARTGDYLDFGYNSAAVVTPLAGVRDRTGLFSLANIPSNVYFYFLSPPKPIFDDYTYQLVPPYIEADVAMGFFFLSPIFFYLWRLKVDERWKKISVGVAVFTTFVLLSYYALNAYEFGARYLVDVLPLYYVLLLTCFQDSKLMMRDKVLIATSAGANLYLFTTIPWT